MLDLIHFVGYLTTLYVIGLVPMWWRAETYGYERHWHTSEAVYEAIGWPLYWLERLMNARR
jgi:hypothetical protein